MNTQVRIFNNPEFGSIRVANSNEGESLFCLADVCKALNIANPRNIIQRLDDREVSTQPLQTAGGVQLANFVTRAGVASCVSNSDKATPLLKKKILNWLGFSDVVIIPRYETEFAESLLDFLGVFNINVTRQFSVNDYRIDFYIPASNLAIEYDEEHHNSDINTDLDIQRQSDIVKEIGCSFLRLDYKKTHSHNIGIVLKKILKIKGAAMNETKVTRIK